MILSTLVGIASKMDNMEKLNRNRILNAVIYFASNVSACGKIKLFKLLYLMDFEHFRKTGRSVTGYEYQAWKFGPVPTYLMEEWEGLEDDLSAVIHIEYERVFNYQRQTVKVNEGVHFDDCDFTKRQLELMRDIASRFEDTFSPEMIDVTHEQNGAWDKVWNEGKGAQKVIPYQLSIPDSADDREYILESASEASGFSTSLNGTDY